jgi:hypothetical protein
VSWTCACGFIATTWNQDSHSCHKAHHLAAFPDADERTVDALDQNIRRSLTSQSRTPNPYPDKDKNELQVSAHDLVDRMLAVTEGNN